jgi:hypothetical protein
MAYRPWTFGWLTVVLGGFTVFAGTAAAQENWDDARNPRALKSAPVGIPLDEIPAALREKVRAVAEQPTLCTRGPTEAFACQPVVYHWLLDHPDKTVQLWHMLGAKCTDIDKQADSKFCYQDDKGSKVTWGTVLDNGKQRIWYAEGQVKPGMLLPVVQMQAVLVLSYTEGIDGKGHPAVQHHMDLLIKTDSQAIALATRLLGASGPRMAEQYVGQIEMFFAAMSWYLDRYPERAETMFQELQRAQKGASKGKN